MTCEQTCIECGDDIGPHHICTDCLETTVGSLAYQFNAGRIAEREAAARRIEGLPVGRRWALNAYVRRDIAASAARGES